MAFFLVVFYLRPRTVATIRASTATTTASTPTSLSLSASTSSPTLTPTQYAFVYCTTAAAAVAVAVVAGGLGVVVIGEHGGKWNRERGTGAGFACMRGREMHNMRAQRTVQIEHTAWLEEEKEGG